MRYIENVSRGGSLHAWHVAAAPSAVWLRLAYLGCSASRRSTAPVMGLSHRWVV